jgi:GNAT superfamily N-acetyltransferase
MLSTPINSPHITFTVAKACDAEELIFLRIEAMRDSLERIGRFDPVRARERFLSTFSPERTRHILLKGARVGFVVVKQQDEGLLLDHLYVHPSFQGQGIGSAVLMHVFAEAKISSQSIRVGALRNSDSNRFYVRHGFQLVEQAEYDNYYVRVGYNVL